MTKAPDLLRRFTPTPLVAQVRMMERTIWLETNSQVVLERTRQAFGCHREVPSGSPDFLWRIVSEADPCFKPGWPEMTAFSDQGLTFVSMDQRGFLAVDLRAREAVAFLAEELAKDEMGFRRPFLAMVFSITAPALRLLPVSAACVALGERGLLIFGPPASGKTTSAYLAGKLGLEFHADHLVFLDLEGGGLRAWGEFWPAVFYGEAERLLAEVRATAQPFHYGQRTCLYLDRVPKRAQGPHRVIPACCLFLEKHKAKPFRLTALDPAAFTARLEEYCLFQNETCSAGEGAAISNALRGLPAYALSYEGDPAAAAIVLRSLLTSQELMEGKL